MEALSTNASFVFGIRWTPAGNKISDCCSQAVFILGASSARGSRVTRRGIKLNAQRPDANLKFLAARRGVASIFFLFFPLADVPRTA